MFKRYGTPAAQQRYANLPIGSNNMIGRPTIVPAAGVEGQGLGNIETDPYFALEVDTTALTEPTKIVLFDGSGGYQMGYNYQMPLAVVIRGLTSDYDFMKTDMVHNGSFFDLIKMRVVVPTNNNNSNCCSSDVPLVQFAHPIKVYNSSKGSEPRLTKTIFPDMGIHEMQQQLNINHLKSPTIVTNRTALVYTQEPGIKLVLGFYQQAEFGRQQ